MNSIHPENTNQSSGIKSGLAMPVNQVEMIGSGLIVEWNYLEIETATELIAGRLLEQDIHNSFSSNSEMDSGGNPSSGCYIYLNENYDKSIKVPKLKKFRHTTNIIGVRRFN